MEGQIVSLLVQSLERLNESVQEDANGVHNILGMEDLPHSPGYTIPQQVHGRACGLVLLCILVRHLLYAQ